MQRRHGGDVGVPTGRGTVTTPFDRSMNDAAAIADLGDGERIGRSDLPFPETSDREVRSSVPCGDAWPASNRDETRDPMASVCRFERRRVSVCPRHRMMHARPYRGVSSRGCPVGTARLSPATRRRTSGRVVPTSSGSAQAKPRATGRRRDQSRSPHPQAFRWFVPAVHRDPKHRPGDGRSRSCTRSDRRCGVYLPTDIRLARRPRPDPSGPAASHPSSAVCLETWCSFRGFYPIY